MNTKVIRPGTMVNPSERLESGQIRDLHEASMQILDDPGILCFNEEATSIFSDKGCRVSKGKEPKTWIVRIPAKLVDNAIETTPYKVTLGARNPENSLELDAQVPRIYFGTGSETNICLETSMETFQSVNDPGLKITYPVFHGERGSIKHLCDSARLCNALNNVDFFIRNINIQDEDVLPEDKDVNVFLASLMYMTKHVQGGISHIHSLDKVVRLAEIIAGGPDALKSNPLISFIACLVKSPLQMVEDTTQKVIEIAKRGLPLVISSSPQGGSTAPVQEEGMVAMINAEIIAGITLAQLVRPETPVLYGAVPVRARLDTLHDFYGAPEFVHYNADCVQMARYYGIPCYSTAGVGDSKVPGLQATVEKLMTYLGVASSGAQYIHYAFGLLDRTSIFCPLQAVLDNASLTMVRNIVRRTRFDKKDIGLAVKEVRKVMSSKTGLFARHIRRHMGRGVVSDPFTLSGDGARDEVFEKAYEELTRIRTSHGEPLPDGLVKQLYDEIPGLQKKESFIL